jgi:hypothetical protein
MGTVTTLGAESEGLLIPRTLSAMSLYAEYSRDQLETLLTELIQKHQEQEANLHEAAVYGQELLQQAEFAQADRVRNSEDIRRLQAELEASEMRLSFIVAEKGKAMKNIDSLEKQLYENEIEMQRLRSDVTNLHSLKKENMQLMHRIQRLEAENEKEKEELQHAQEAHSNKVEASKVSADSISLKDALEEAELTVTILQQKLASAEEMERSLKQESHRYHELLVACEESYVEKQKAILSRLDEALDQNERLEISLAARQAEHFRAAASALEVDRMPTVPGRVEDDKDTPQSQPKPDLQRIMAQMRAQVTQSQAERDAALAEIETLRRQATVAPPVQRRKFMDFGVLKEKVVSIMPSRLVQQNDEHRSAIDSSPSRHQASHSKERQASEAKPNSAATTTTTAINLEAAAEREREQKSKSQAAARWAKMKHSFVPLAKSRR